MGKHSSYRRTRAYVAGLYQQAQAKFEPYREVGLEALEKIKDEAFDVEAGPLWQYMYEQGAKLIRQQAAARGLVKSGPGMEAVTQFTEEMALQHINWKMGQWWELTNMGTWASAQQANILTGQAESMKQMYEWGEQMKQQGYSQMGSMIMGGVSSGMGMGMGMSGGGSSGGTTTGMSAAYQPAYGVQTAQYYGTPTVQYPTSYATNYMAPSYYR